MIEQCRQDGAITLVLDRFLGGRGKQIPRLVVADRRRLAFAALGPGPLDAFDWIVSDGVLVRKRDEVYRSPPYFDGVDRVVLLVWWLGYGTGTPPSSAVAVPDAKLIGAAE